MDKRLIGGAIAFGIISIIATAWFFGKFELKTQSPISISIRKPIYFVKRVLAINVTKIQVNDENNSPLTPIQQYICNKFGKDCKLALAIQHAENASAQCDRINWSNKDQSIDIGVFQINSLWIDHKKFPAASLFDCKANVDAAYAIYKANGESFKDWSTFQSGVYKNYMY